MRVERELLDQGGWRKMIEDDVQILSCRQPFDQFLQGPIFPDFSGKRFATTNRTLWSFLMFECESVDRIVSDVLHFLLVWPPEDIEIDNLPSCNYSGMARKS